MRRLTEELDIGPVLLSLEEEQLKRRFEMEFERPDRSLAELGLAVQHSSAACTRIRSNEHLIYQDGDL